MFVAPVSRNWKLPEQHSNGGQNNEDCLPAERSKNHAHSAEYWAGLELGSQLESACKVQQIVCYYMWLR